jgi:hypothetical protein
MRTINILACIAISFQSVTAALAQSTPNPPIPFRVDNQTNNPATIICSGAGKTSGHQTIGANTVQSIFYHFQGTLSSASPWVCEVSGVPSGQITGNCSFSLDKDVDQVCLVITKAGAGCTLRNC